MRGIWRKTTLADYISPQPHWTTVLDIDALNKAEGKSWVFKGAEFLKPDETRCMVALSDGGEDAVVAREFDLDTGKFVDGGFTLAARQAPHRLGGQGHAADRDRLDAGRPDDAPAIPTSSSG